MNTLDVVYVTASARDARLTRICIASIRAFYPQVPIKILCGSTLERGLLDELRKYWAVGVADVPSGDYGWGFVKLEPLFGRPGERFLVVDSDTVFAGPVLDAWAASSADFLVDDEQQTEADTHRLYYDWRKVAAIDPAARQPQFVFNTGQWFGTSDVLTRADFAPLIDWTAMPPRVRYPELFPPNDQGVFNYVLNQKVIGGPVVIERRKIMRWPWHGMDGITAAAITNGNAPALIVHWAGFKSARLRSLPGSDVLSLFERRYYAKLPLGPFVMHWRAARYLLANVVRKMVTKVHRVCSRLRASADPPLPAVKANPPRASVEGR